MKTSSNWTFEELERKAYMEGHIELANLYYQVEKQHYVICDLEDELEKTR